jgi:integrase/recombinase XerD
MTIDSTVDQLRQRMIEDIVARKRGLACQKSHLRAYKRFSAWLQRSPDTATADEIRLFQVHLAETGVGICTRNNTMTGLRFLFRVTLRRHDLAAEIYHLKEPQKVPMILNADETKRLLAMASSVRDRLMLSLGYGAGLRSSEILRLKVKHIDSAQMVIRVEQSKGRKDRLVMLSPDMLDLLREWWKARPKGRDAGIPVQERLLFPSFTPGRPMTTRNLARQYQRPVRAAGIAAEIDALGAFHRGIAASEKPAHLQTHALQHKLKRDRTSPAIFHRDGVARSHRVQQPRQQEWEFPMRSADAHVP